MTQPTQAQIDAAAKAIREYRQGDFPEDLQDIYRGYAKAALAAAAEVGQSEAFLGGVAEGTFATIERCAQVAEKELSPEVGAEVAAAIRALSTEEK